MDHAWDARGRGWASGVSEKGWRLFEERLALAEAELTRAWEMDPALPETPLQMMRMELGQGRGRPRLELWYERALAFPENRYRALDLKLWYLQPRWHGSEAACLAVAREALKSDLFTGECPLHLYLLHQSLAEYYGERRPNYWVEPQVWPDIRTSFERYFAQEGASNSWRHNYVRAAWRCR